MSKEGRMTAKMPEIKRGAPILQTRKKNLSPSHNSSIDYIKFLHKTLGNQAVQRLFKFRIIQAKLRIGALNDIYEQEADRVADMVMRMPEKDSASASVSEGSKSAIQLKPG